LATLWADLERVDSIAFFLRQKLANLNTALGFGQNDQHEAATSKSRKDTSVCRNVHVSISASWFVGELGVSATWLSASWFVGELSSYRFWCTSVPLCTVICFIWTMVVDSENGLLVPKPSMQKTSVKERKSDAVKSSINM